MWHLWKSALATLLFLFCGLPFQALLGPKAQAVVLQGTITRDPIAPQVRVDLSARDPAETQLRLNWGGVVPVHTGFLPGGYYECSALSAHTQGLHEGDDEYMGSQGALTWRGGVRRAQDLILAGIPLDGRYDVGLIGGDVNLSGLGALGVGSRGSLVRGLLSGEYHPVGVTARFGPFGLSALKPGAFLIKKETMGSSDHYTVSLRFGGQHVRGRITVNNAGSRVYPSVAEFYIETTWAGGRDLDLQQSSQRLHLRALMVFLSLLTLEWL